MQFRCETTGYPLPQLDWIRVHGNMSPEATFNNGVWYLAAALKNDAAEYKCVARNNVGKDEKTTILYVRGTIKIFMYLGRREIMYLTILDHTRIIVELI